MTTLSNEKPDVAQVRAGNPSSNKAAAWTGRVFSGIVFLSLLFDGAIKVLQLKVAVGTAAELG